MFSKAEIHVIKFAYFGTRWRCVKCSSRSMEELDGPAASALRRAIAEVKQRWSVIGCPKIYYLKLLRASEGTVKPGSGCICSR
jgi:hypothetical protein